MSDLERLKQVLKAAYDAGFGDGNGMDWGCNPDDHGDFDGWFLSLDLGSVVTGVAALSNARPKLAPHEVIQFEPHPGLSENQFVVGQIQHGPSGTFVELQDRASWERLHREPPF